MPLPPAAAGPEALLLGQACALAALRYSTLRASDAAKAASLAREAADEAERSLLPRVRALLSLGSSSSSSSSPPSSALPSLRVDLGSGVLARATPVKDRSAIVPIGLGFYLESGGGGGSDGGGGEAGGEEEALALAAARVDALRDRARRAAARASRARAEAEGDARAALRR